MEKLKAVRVVKKELLRLITACGEAQGSSGREERAFASDNGVFGQAVRRIVCSGSIDGR